MSKIKLKTAIVIFFFILAVIGSLAGPLVVFNNVDDYLTEEVFNHLRTTAQSRADHISNLLRDEKENVEVAAIHPELTVEKLKQIMELNSEYYEVFVLDKNGREVRTTNPGEEPGEDFSENVLFLEGKKGSYIGDYGYDEEFDRYGFGISTPHSGGVLVVKMEIEEEIGEITTDRTGLGETGEVYLVNKDKYLMTPSRFFDNSLLVQEVHTDNSRKCFWDMAKYHGESLGEVVEHEHDISAFLDYRGEKVIGTHSYIPEMKWCLLAEIDEAEALGKTRGKLLKLVFIVSAVIVLPVALISFLVGKKIEKVYRRSR